MTRGDSDLNSGSGVAFGVGAYGLWGLFPAFFGLLAFADSTEILANRIVWTLVVMIVVMGVLGRLGALTRVPRRTWFLVAAASAMISINWGMYIYGVVTGRVVEAALGYFINPLVSVLFGVVFFRERLTRVQLAAVGLAVIAVAVLTVDYGHPPIISLTLAFSFALYGVLKKVVPLDPPTSLTAEGVVGLPFALGYLVFLAVTGTGTFIVGGAAHTALLLVCGPITAVPLLLFGAAAKRVPLVTMGILQYLTPALQLVWGIAVLHESMPAARWAGFALIWAALVIFTVDGVRRLRVNRKATLDPLAATTLS